MLIPDWRKALNFYSVQAAIIGGAVLTGIAAVQAFGLAVPSYWTQIAAGLTISSIVILRLVKQDKTAMPDLPAPPPETPHDET